MEAIEFEEIEVPHLGIIEGMVVSFIVASGLDMAFFVQEGNHPLA